MALFRGPNVSNDGLVLVLDAANRKSYPGTGTNWKDLSNVSNVTVDTSLVTYDNNSFSATSLNQYIWFGGTNPALTNLTDNGNSHTFECWWMPLGTPPGANDGYFCGRRGTHLGHRQLRSNGLNHNCVIWFQNPTSNLTVGTTYTYPSYGVWGHLCYVVDEVNNVAKYYVNGVQRGSDTSIAGLELRDYGTVDYHLFSGSGTNWSGNGRIGLTRFYSRALTATEILQNYTATKSRFGL
jgi:hypothetical protein